MSTLNDLPILAATNVPDEGFPAAVTVQIATHVDNVWKGRSIISSQTHFTTEHVQLDGRLTRPAVILAVVLAQMQEEAASRGSYLPQQDPRGPLYIETARTPRMMHGDENASYFYGEHADRYVLDTIIVPTWWQMARPLHDPMLQDEPQMDACGFFQRWADQLIRHYAVPTVRSTREKIRPRIMPQDAATALAEEETPC